MPFPVVLFDLDGTLTDSQAGIVASYRYALAAVGLAADESRTKALIGPPLEQNLLTLGVAAADVSRATAAYRQYFVRRGMYENRLYDGAVDALAELSSGGTRLGVATSKLVDFAHAILEHFQISHFFEVVSGASRDGSRSHKADVAAHALEGLGYPQPSSVALVGDREQDMYAAAELGLYGVGALWGYGSEAELRQAGAQVLVGSPEALVPVLQRAEPR